MAVELDQSLLRARFERDALDGVAAAERIIGCVERRSDFIDWASKSPGDFDSSVHLAQTIAKGQTPRRDLIEREWRALAQWAADKSDAYLHDIRLSSPALHQVLTFRVVELVCYVRVHRAIAAVRHFAGAEPLSIEMPSLEVVLAVAPDVHRAALAEALENALLTVKVSEQVPPSAEIARNLERSMRQFEWKITRVRASRGSIEQQAHMLYLHRIHLRGEGSYYGLARDRRFFGPNTDPEVARGQVMEWVKKLAWILRLDM